jgi:hypothetical protein
MAEQFNEEDREDLMERGFNNEQIEYLESLEMDPDELFSDICKIMDDFGDTPEQIIASYQEANDNNNNPPAPLQGGRRRKSRKGKSRKTRSRKSKKTRKTRSRKSKKTRKRRSYKRR